MDELIDIVNSQGIPTGNTCLKSFAHQNGILHASIHVWFYTINNKILVQKRKEDKDIFPSLWDISVAGHIASGEIPLNAAVREVKEEIGIKISHKELNFIGLFEEKHHHVNGMIDYEIHYIYLAQLNCKISKLVPQKEEVSALKLINIQELENNYTNSNLYVPHHHEYYNFIINKLKETK